MTAGDPSGLCRSLGYTSARTYIPGSRTPLPGPCTVSEHSSELLGCPISRSLATSCVGLELRLLPSTGITRLHRYYGPLRHPNAPGLSLTGVRLIIPDHALGFPCCVRFPCVHAAAATPVQRSSHPAVSAFPEGSVGLHIVLLEVCSAFTRVATCTLARSPYFVTRYPKGFRHFVTTMPAPVASGSSGRRVEIPPTGKRRLFTAHTRIGHSLRPSQRKSRLHSYPQWSGLSRRVPKPHSAARLSVIGPAGAPSCALRALIERRACSIARNTGQ